MNREPAFAGGRPYQRNVMRALGFQGIACLAARRRCRGKMIPAFFQEKFERRTSFSYMPEVIKTPQMWSSLGEKRNLIPYRWITLQRKRFLFYKQKYITKWLHAKKMS